jgi:hypothetical protein
MLKEPFVALMEAAFLKQGFADVFADVSATLVF